MTIDQPIALFLFSSKRLQREIELCWDDTPSLLGSSFIPAALISSRPVIQSAMI